MAIVSAVIGHPTRGGATLRSKRFKVTTNPQQVVVDGEVIGTTPVEIEC